MPEHDQTEDKLPAAEAQQDMSKGSDAKAEVTDAAIAGDELSEDDLETVAGGGASCPPRK